jgi:hypothetical protein
VTAAGKTESSPEGGGIREKLKDSFMALEIMALDISHS